MKQYKIGIFILSLVLFSSNIGGVCLTNSPQKVISANKKVISDLNLLRVKLQKKTLQTDSIIDKHMVDIANITDYNDLDSLRKNLREKWICDYDVRLFKFKHDENIPTLGLDIENNYPEVLKALNDSGYNKLGVNVKKNEITILLTKNYVSIDSLSFNGPKISEFDGRVIPSKLFFRIKGKTKINKLYYHILDNANNVGSIKNANKKTDNLEFENNVFNLKIEQNVNSIAFVDENNKILSIFNLR